MKNNQAVLDNPSATYRGYRNQALYVLFRILTDEEAEHRVYRPEGAEDLAIFDDSSSLVEAVQVKDYSSDLAFSHLVTFFKRLNERIDEEPECITYLAGFGALGSEMLGAIKGVGKHQTKIVAKLCEKVDGLNETRALEILTCLKGRYIQLSREEIYNEVKDFLNKTIVSAELNLSVDLFTYWIYEASEKQQDITRTALLLKLDQIGDYLASLRDESAEWQVSVSPIKKCLLDDQERSRLIEEYRRGVQATWKHIVASADFERKERIREIHTTFKNHPVVIIRGASGQGKSSLGWRYLYDYCVDGLRFHVKYVEAQSQAEKIANVLSSHTKQLKLKAVVYLDIAPSDRYWPELVSSLAGEGLKVLVAVREEDFRRSSISSANFDFGEIILDGITKVEAQPIYEELKKSSNQVFLDFDDAWNQFGGEEGGPLLEFTYLISQGTSLKGRISKQINRLRDDAVNMKNGITAQHLKMLGLAALANETGAGVSLKKLCEVVGIDPLVAPLKLLEDEYLLKEVQSGNDTIVQGLHIIRSQIIVTCLLEDEPDLWRELAVSVISVVADNNLEIYLLALFEKDINVVDSIVQTLCTIPVETWAQAGEIGRALIWGGASSYEVKNAAVIKNAIVDYGGAWAYVGDFHIGMLNESSADILESFKEVVKKITQKEIPSLSLSPKSEVFDWLKNWSKNIKVQTPPKTVQDWQSIGDLAHWIGECKSVGSLYNDLAIILPEPLPDHLSIEQIGDFISGIACLDKTDFGQWHTRVKDDIKMRFVKETNSVFVEDNENQVKVYFNQIVSEKEHSNKDGKLDLHDQTMFRIELLRKLYPSHGIISSQALGIEIMDEFMIHDESQKEIKSEKLLLTRSTELNSLFNSLTNYRQNRPDNWNDYKDLIWKFRVKVSDIFRRLFRGWEQLLSETSPKQNTIKKLPIEELSRFQELLKSIPMYPRTAVDKWGFVSEDKNKDNQINPKVEKALHRFSKWKKCFNDYKTGVTNFCNNFLMVTEGFLLERKGEVLSDDQKRALYLNVINLTNAWKALESMQIEFDRHFGALVDEQKLLELTRNERSNFAHLWAVTFAMNHLRDEKVTNMVRIVESRIKEKELSFLKALKNEICEVMKQCGDVRILESGCIIEGESHLCIVCNFTSLHDTEQILPEVVWGIWRATKSDEWLEQEWAPLEVKWPKLAIVNLINGKALIPACATIYTSVIFGSKDDFDVQPYHYTALPVSKEDFYKAGFFVWNTPFVSAVINLQVNVFEFILICGRFNELLIMVSNYPEAEKESDRIFSDCSTELTVQLALAHQSYKHLANITVASDYEMLADLKESCEMLLFTLDENAKVDLTIETLLDWVEKSEYGIKLFQNSVNSLLDNHVNDRTV
ncbi:MAG: hypothetical protein ACSHXL_01010 [Bacteroidota bacterium]